MPDLVLQRNRTSSLLLGQAVSCNAETKILALRGGRGTSPNSPLFGVHLARQKHLSALLGDEMLALLGDETFALLDDEMLALLGDEMLALLGDKTFAFLGDEMLALLGDEMLALPGNKMFSLIGDKTFARLGDEMLPLLNDEMLAPIATPPALIATSLAPLTITTDEKALQNQRVL